MKAIHLLVITFLFITQFSLGQTTPEQSPSTNPEWYVGLHGSAQLGNRTLGITGFGIYPGIYRMSGKIMYGFTPFYSHTSDTYQAVSNEPENIQTWTTNSYGGIFQFRYYLNDRKFRPYFLAQGGFAHQKDNLTVLPEYGESYTEKYWDFNVGAGFGTTYLINDKWSLDGNIVFDMRMAPNKDTDGHAYLSLGIFYRMGR